MNGHAATNGHSAAPTRELVVARYKEELLWLHQVPEDMAITVINKGWPILEPLPPRTRIIASPNTPHTREAGSYMVWLSQRYDDLPDYAYFTQARWDDHTPSFLDRLREPPHDGYRGLTRRYNETIPPPTLLPLDPLEERDEWINAWTLNFLQFEDPESYKYSQNLQVLNGLPEGSNSVLVWMRLLGVTEEHLPLVPTVVRFTYGAIFSVPRRMILQHRRSVYERLHEQVGRDWTMGYVAERCWRLLFEGVTAVAQLQPTLHEQMPTIPRSSGGADAAVNGKPTTAVDGKPSFDSIVAAMPRAPVRKLAQR